MIFDTLVKHVVGTHFQEVLGHAPITLLKVGSLKWYFPHSDGTFQKKLKHFKHIFKVTFYKYYDFVQIGLCQYMLSLSQRLTG